MSRLLGRYLALHAQNFLGAWGRLARQPMGSLMTILVIGIALALPAGLGVVLANAQDLSRSWEGAADFTVYLQMDVEEARARELAAEVQARSDVSRVELVTRERALEEFRAHSGFGEALQALERNPLPHALVVRPAGVVEGNVESLAADLEALEETQFVQLDTAWVARLRAILVLTGRAVDIATVLLGLAVLVVIGNTIRLEINNRRDEIEVVKLVGASDGFIRRPFLYLGLCYGLAGGIMAAALIGLSLGVVGGPVSALSQLYGSSYELSGLSLTETGLLLGGGAVLGWAGAGLAAARHLRAIEPS